MSTTSNNYDAENHQSVGSETTESEQTDCYLAACFQQGGRYILVDPDTGDRLNVSRLTAYAEYGEEIHEKDAHHEIPVLQIDAPRFVQPLSREEHTRYHRQGPEPVDVDGFPLLRPGR